MVTRYYRIQAADLPLPDRSASWYAGGGDDLPGVCAFVNLYHAAADLLGGEWDANGVCYAESLREDGHTPILSIFEGDFIADDAGAGAIVEPDRDSEVRITADQLWDAYLAVLAREYPEDAASLESWPRDAEGWEALDDEFDLIAFEREVVEKLCKSVGRGA